MDSPANFHANLSSNHDSAIKIWSNAMSTFSFHVPTKGFSDYACIFLRNTIFLVISPFTSSLVFRSAKFHEFRILVPHYHIILFSYYVFLFHLRWVHTFFVIFWKHLHGVLASRKDTFRFGCSVAPDFLPCGDMFLPPWSHLSFHDLWSGTFWQHPFLQLWLS